MKIVRIICCILACLSVAAVVPIGIFFEWTYIVFPIAAAGLFAFTMLFAKNKSEPAPPEEVNFMNSDEKNAAIRKENEENKDNGEN